MSDRSHSGLKSSVALHVAAWLAGALWLLTAAGCGQKGPLSHPPSKATGAPAAASAPAR